MTMVWTPVEMTMFILIMMGLANATGFYFGKIKGIEITMKYFEDRGVVKIDEEWNDKD